MRAVCRVLILILLVAASLSAFAADGALTNDDLIKLAKAGIDDNVMIAKIGQAKAVEFALEADDLIALKEAGVSSGVVAAMLERGTAKPAISSAGTGAPVVQLIAGSETIELSSIEGDHHQFAAPFVGLKHFLEFDRPAAETRISDPEPVIRINLDKDPSRRWYFVKLDPDNDDPTRGLDLRSAGMWGGAHDYSPDGDFVIKSEVKQTEDGLWQFTPKKKLKPGEYGLYNTKGFVYDFGIDD